MYVALQIDEESGVVGFFRALVADHFGCGPCSVNVSHLIENITICAAALIVGEIAPGSVHFPVGSDMNDGPLRIFRAFRADDLRFQPDALIAAVLIEKARGGMAQNSRPIHPENQDEYPI